jgi:hypothetical protein
VRAEGIEPPRFSPPEPKSGASTSSATPATCWALTARPSSASDYSNRAAPCTKKLRAPMEKMAVLDGLIGTYVAALPLGQEKLEAFSMRIILASTVLSSRAGVRDVSEGSGGPSIAPNAPLL